MKTKIGKNNKVITGYLIQGERELQNESSSAYADIDNTADIVAVNPLESRFSTERWK
jgi:hypothetical protein